MLNPNANLIVKQNYKSTPTVLNKVIDLVKLDKDKFVSKKNGAKLINADIHYFSNDHKKTPMIINDNIRKASTIKNIKRVSKDEENVTSRDHKSINNKKNIYTPKILKNLKKENNLTNTIILTTNRTENNKDSPKVHLKTIPSDYNQTELEINEGKKINDQDLKHEHCIIKSVDNDSLEKNILLSIQNFGTLLRIGSSKAIKINENNPEIRKLNNLLGDLKSSASDSILNNEMIKRDTLRSEDSNKKLELREQNSLLMRIKRENIINKIYLSSDTRIKKYGLFFEFFSDNIKEINKFLKPEEQIKENNNFSTLSKLRIIEKTLSNFENKASSNVVSEISLFNETEKNEQKNLAKKYSINKLSIRDGTQGDCHCSEMQENAVVNIPSDLSAIKIKIINVENIAKVMNNSSINNITQIKLNYHERKHSTLDLLDNKSINSEYCRNGKVYDDDQIMKNLEFDLQSNVSSLKNLSKYFQMDYIRPDYRYANEEIKDLNSTVLVNDFQSKVASEKKSHSTTRKLPMRIKSIKNMLNMERSMDRLNRENNDLIIIQNNNDVTRENNSIRNIKTEKNLR